MDPVELEKAMNAELERRVRVLGETDDATFGRITPLEWGLAVLVFVIVPLLVVLVSA